MKIRLTTAICLEGFPFSSGSTVDRPDDGEALVNSGLAVPANASGSTSSVVGTPTKSPDATDGAPRRRPRGDKTKEPLTEPKE